MSTKKPMINETLLKIAEFSELPEGWHFGEGKRISKDNVSIAERIFYAIFYQGIVATDAFPGIDGEIRITGYFDEHYLEFTLETDESITYLYEIDDIEIEYKENLSIVEVLEVIKTITTKINPNKCLFDQSIKTIGINKKSDFKVWHSNPPAVTEGFQLFAVNALSNIADAYAPMPIDIMPLSQILLLSSGNSTRPFSQTITRSTKPLARVETFATAI